MLVSGMGRADAITPVVRRISVDDPHHASDLEPVQRMRWGDRATLEAFVGCVWIVSWILTMRN